MLPFSLVKSFLKNIYSILQLENICAILSISKMKVGEQMTTGDRIKMYRERKNLTQNDLAKYLNVSPQAIHKYEHGVVCNIPLDKIEELANVLDVPPGVLVGWQNDSNDEGGEPPQIWIDIYTYVSKFSTEKQDELGMITWGILTSNHNPVYTWEEHNLLMAWRKARPEDKEIIDVVLRKYGFPGSGEHGKKEEVV